MKTILFSLSTFLLSTFQLLIAQNFAIDNIEFAEQPNNVLRFDLFVTISSDALVYAKFYELEEGPANSITTNISNAGTFHTIPLLGLKEFSSYAFSVHAFNESGSIQSEEYIIDVNGLPEEIVKFELPEVNEIGVNDNYIIADAFAPFPPQIRVFDHNGEIVWYGYMGESDVPFGCQSYTYDPKEKSIITFECHKIQERTLAGELIFETYIDENKFLHHDIIKNQNGNYVVIFAESRIVDQSSVGGSLEANLVGDGLLEINSAGEVVWSWSAFDHFDLVTATGGAFYWDNEFGSGSIDWMHSNSLDQDGEGNYLLSVPEQNRIFKINSVSGEITWIFGENGDFNFDHDYQFDYQHGVHFSGFNSIMLFDNRGLGFQSRAIEFNIDDVNLTADVNWVYELDGIFSPVLSSSYLVSNENKMICDGVSGQIIELNELDEIVWSIKQESGNMFKANEFLSFYKEPDQIEFDFLPTVICSNSNSISLNALPVGGYFTLDGEILDEIFSPSDYPEGNYQIQYNFGEQEMAQAIEIGAFSDINLTIGQSDITANTLIVEDYSGATYNWYYNGVLIEGENSWIINNADLEGLYSVSASIENECEFYSDEFELILNNRVEVKKTEIGLYPNPFIDQINITNHTSNISCFKLFDTQGKLVFNKINPNSIIDFRNLNLMEGIYFCEIWIEDKKQSFKLIHN